MLRRDTSVAGECAHLINAIHVGRGHVPPVGVTSDEWHGELWSGAADENGDAPIDRARPLLRLFECVETTVVVERFAGEERFEKRKLLGEPCRSHRGWLVVDAIDAELRRHRAPTDAELEPALAEVVERYRDLGQHGRMTK